ncbi:MAG: O-antigen ligase family protein [Peptoniphilus sp.]|uniref:O-antigen ligase family protein n=1 Tax=Peptoniphilus sp. TaxID=1971214 RepID=UPI00399BC333
MTKFFDLLRFNLDYNAWDESLIRKLLLRIRLFFENIFVKILEFLKEKSFLFGLLESISGHINIIIALSLIFISIVPFNLWSNLYLYLIVFILWILNLYRKDDKKRLAFDDFLVLFILTIGLSTVFSIYPRLSLKYAVNYFSIFLFYAIFINNIRTRKDLFQILTALTVATLLVSFFGLLQKFVIGVSVDLSQTDTSISQELSGRIYSTMGNPNVLGEYYLLTVPLIVANFLKNENKYIKILSAFTILISMFVLLTTGSRSAWASFAICVFVFTLLYNPRLLPVFFMLGLILFFFLPGNIQIRLMSIFNKSDSSINYRKYIYESANIMKKNFAKLGGVGLGNEVFQAAFENYKAPQLTKVAHCHNLYLQLLIEIGAFGLFFLIGHIIKLFLKILISFKEFREKNPAISLVQYGGIAAICGFMVMSFADYTWFYLRIVSLFFINLAILKASLNIEN